MRNRVKTITTGHNFILPGHSIDDMEFSISVQVKTRDKLYKRKQEKFFIH